MSKFSRKWIGKFLKYRFKNWHIKASESVLRNIQDLKVLVLGAYLSDKVNFASHLVSRFSESTVLKVTQRWVALNGKSPDPQVQAVTRFSYDHLIPKFTLLNQLIEQEDLSFYDIVLISDDDILLPKGFLDAYVYLQLHYGFGLAQPAREIYSSYDHKITLRKFFCKSRQTRFVEIGPLFSIAKCAFASLLPFDNNSPMGFGLDFVWPIAIEKSNLTMGIIDSVPVDHSNRPQASCYSNSENQNLMTNYLLSNPHLTPDEAHKVLRYYRV